MKKVKSIILAIKQRSTLAMVLPLIAIPILAILFWAFGGGKGTAARTENDERAGLNPNLPKAQFNNDEEEWNKLNLYEKAKRDSLKFNEAKRNDPYFRLDLMEVSGENEQRPDELGKINSSLGKKSHDIDSNEKLLRRKIDELSNHMNSINEPTERTAHFPEIEIGQSPDNDVAQLQSMMEMMQDEASGDAEMKQIDDVLGKILDIQHPERVKQRSQEMNKERVTYAASAAQQKDIISLLTNSTDNSLYDSDDISTVELNGFFGTSEDNPLDESHNTIQAIVYDDQTLVNGSFVKLVLQQDVRVEDTVIPRNKFAFGVCSLNGERLTIEISSLRKGNSIYPVSLVAYDLDGLEGIYVPGAMARDAAKQTSDQTLQSLQLNSLDPSIEVQAATAGIEAAKGLLSKKSKMIRVMVKAGHKVLLRDVNSNTKSSIQ